MSSFSHAGKLVKRCASKSGSNSTSASKASTSAAKTSAKTSTKTSATTTASASPTKSASPSKYKLTDLHQGSTFFDGWNFFTGADPTHGNVNFVSQSDAKSKGLTTLAGNLTTIAVDDTTTVKAGGNRDSVRISSKKSYNNGLFVADFSAMPTGCGIWPAWWSAGPNWPAAGEMDIIEGVNKQTTNQYTLHSGSAGGSCTLDKSASSTTSKAFTSNVLGTQCESSDGSNAGCAFSDPDTSSFGAGFNSKQGGVFAHLWDSTGVKMWHFTRTNIPSDITSKNPDPSSWPTPQAAWSSKTCDISAHFYDHVLTLDTTICGDWASGAFTSTGCSGTCTDLVADPKNFVDAKWKINYIAVYQ